MNYNYIADAMQYNWCPQRSKHSVVCLVRYVNVYYHYQLNVNVVNTYFVGPFNTQPLRKVYLFDITFVMKIQTADKCNKKSSSFTNTWILSTKDNLTPRLQVF